MHSNVVSDICVCLTAMMRVNLHRTHVQRLAWAMPFMHWDDGDCGVCDASRLAVMMN